VPHARQPLERGGVARAQRLELGRHGAHVRAQLLQCKPPRHAPPLLACIPAAPATAPLRLGSIGEDVIRIVVVIERIVIVRVIGSAAAATAAHVV
jgi:hypothetical protein